MRISGKWNEATLGDVAQIQTGPFGSQLHEKDYVEKGVPIITVEHLGDNRIIKNDIPCVSDSDVLRLKKFLLEAGDIVFSRVGSVDRSVLIREDENGWMFSGRCLRVRVQKNDITSEYLSYFFAQKNFKQYVRNNAVGATMPSLNSSILRRLKIKYPSTLEQKKITNILSALDDLVDNNRARIQLLEESARLLFREWFVYFRFPGHEKVKIVDGVPEGWKKEKIKKILTLEYGKSLTSDKREAGDVPVYGSSGKIGFHNKALVKGPGIIVGRAGNAGSVHWVNEDFHPVDSTFFVKTMDTDYLFYFYYFLSSCQLERLVGGVAVPGLNRNIVYSSNILLPEKNIIRQFNLMISKINKQCSVLEESDQKLAQARDLLLPRLMNGAIKV